MSFILTELRNHWEKKMIRFFLISGSMDKMTFYYLKDLLSINVTDTQIDPLDFEAFTQLENLEVLQFRNSRINVDKNSKALVENLLTHFRELNFRNSFVADLTRNSFYQLRYLTKLVFDNSEVCNLGKDAFYDLAIITHLAITSTEILDYDFSQILKLKSLKYLALYDVRSNIEINYNLLKYLPNLETVLFDPWVYRNLDLDGFPVLRRCELGLRDDSQEGRDLEYNAVRTEVVTKLDNLKKKKGIDYVIVYPSGRLVD